MRRSADLQEVADVTWPAAGARIATRWTIDREGGDQPVCVAETITLVAA